MKTADTIAAQESQNETVESQNETPEVAGNSETCSKPWLKPFRWKPGQSGNPAGRPKDHARDIARKIFENNPEAVYLALGKALLKGNAYAFKELAERAYGKLTEKRELTGKDGGPIETREVSDAELNERIKQLERDLGLAAAIDDAGRVGLAAAGTNKANGQAKD